jgi:hypothetical protein
LRRMDFPSAEENAVRSADVELFAMGICGGEGGVCFADQIGSEFAADGSEETWSEEPAAHGGENGRYEEQDECDADQAITHGRPHLEIRKKSARSSGFAGGSGEWRVMSGEKMQRRKK